MLRPGPNVLSFPCTLGQELCDQLTCLGLARAGWELKDLSRIERVRVSDRLGLERRRRRYLGCGCNCAGGGDCSSAGKLLRVRCHIGDSP